MTATSRETRDAVAMFLDRCRCRDGSFADPAYLSFESREIRPLFDATKTLAKYEEQVDDPSPVRASAFILGDVVNRCKGQSGKVAASGFVVVTAEEARAIQKAVRFLTEYDGLRNAAADRRSRKRDKA